MWKTGRKDGGGNDDGWNTSISPFFHTAENERKRKYTNELIREVEKV